MPPEESIAITNGKLMELFIQKGEKSFLEFVKTEIQKATEREEANRLSELSKQRLLEQKPTSTMTLKETMHRRRN